MVKKSSKSPQVVKHAFFIPSLGKSVEAKDAVEATKVVSNVSDKQESGDAR